MQVQGETDQIYREALKAARLRGKEGICDLSCGDGRFLLRLRIFSDELHLAGAEQDPKRLSQARQIFFPVHRVHLIQSDGPSLPFKSGIFDRLFLLDPDGRLSQSPWAAWDSEIYRLLSPTGRVVCIIPTVSSLKSQVSSPFVSNGWSLDRQWEISAGRAKKWTGWVAGKK